MKEHVLMICIFANAGSGFGYGSAYADIIVNIIKGGISLSLIVLH